MAGTHTDSKVQTTQAASFSEAPGPSVEQEIWGEESTPTEGLITGHTTRPSADQFIRDLVRQAMPQQVQGHEVNGLRYSYDVDGCLQHRCAAWLPGAVARTKLGGFLQDWQAEVLEAAESRLVFQILLGHGLWDRLCGLPTAIEVQISLTEPRSGMSNLREAVVRMRCLGGTRPKARTVLEKVAPALLGSLRSFLMAPQEQRADERFPFVHPLSFSPSTGDVADAVPCLGRDISLGGISFATACPPAVPEIRLYFPICLGPSHQTTSISILATVRAVMPEGKEHLVRAHFAFDPAPQGRQLLFVGRDPGIALRMRSLLAQCADFPAALHCAEQVPLALEYLRRERIDAILLDGSPGCDLDMFRRIRAAAPSLPTLVLTGEVDGALTCEVVREGAECQPLVKLQDGNALAQALQTALQGEEAKHHDALSRERQRMLAEAQRRRQRERYLAYHDALTDLPNRCCFGERLAHAVALAQQQGTLLAVLFIDLDGFKKVNDTHGHQVGDRLLQTAAQRLQGCVRQSDTVARLGGDEFTVIVNDIVQPQEAIKVAQKILTVLGQPVVIDGHKLRVTASIGISTFPRDGADTEALVNGADLAMYRAKRQGKDNWQLAGHP